MKRNTQRGDGEAGGLLLLAVLGIVCYQGAKYADCSNPMAPTQPMVVRTPIGDEVEAPVIAGCKAKIREHLPHRVLDDWPTFGPIERPEDKIGSGITWRNWAETKKDGAVTRHHFVCRWTSATDIVVEFNKKELR